MIQIDAFYSQIRLIAHRRLELLQSLDIKAKIKPNLKGKLDTYIIEAQPFKTR
jgi:hypothetical protein